jgi:energy-coupling factor transport system permease protein
VKGGLAFVLIIFFSLAALEVSLLAGFLVCLLAMLLLARLPLRSIFFSIRRISLLLIIVGLVQGFKGDGFDLLAAFEGIIRILGVFFTAGVYLTISPQSELMYFWEIVFMPLEFFRLPARELALVMVIAVRFLPVMLTEIDRIRMAQIARGARLSGGFFSSAASLMPLMIPTLSQAIVKAEELAEAMEARGYRVSAARTRYHRFRFSFFDLIWVTLAGVIFVLTIVSRFSNFNFWC